MFNILFKYFVAIYKTESKTNSYGTATLLQITCNYVLMLHYKCYITK